MKKYIRTKDGIMKIDFEIEDELPVMIGVQTEECVIGEYRGIEVIKQADTIEELCDEFVDTSELKTSNTGGWLYDEFDNKNKCLVYYAEDERRTIPLNEFDDLSKIFGAIWTELGLKYVAKMNDKGEFELL